MVKDWRRYGIWQRETLWYGEMWRFYTHSTL